MRATVIGLGAMGGAVAERLITSGVDTGVADIDSGAVDRLVSIGGRHVDVASATTEDLGSFVITSLPNDQVVTDVVLTDGLLDRLGDAILIELSTTLPKTVEVIGQRAAEAGLRVVDSPVSGGPDEARAGKLTLIVGADAEVLDAARPLLEVLGSIEHVGAVGTGKAVKLVNNLISMGNVAVAAEAFTLGTELGIDGRLLYDVLSRSGCRSAHFQKRMPWALDEDYAARFAVNLGEKDVRLGLQLAHERDYVMPVASIVHQLFEMGRAKGFGQQDVISLRKLYEDWAHPTA
jgi:3-hydroxyisobutyrate dehydrogenase